ncbi:MAG TPA: hypothetical protein DCO72_06040 [Ruminococcus sp.]|nr:hypothetical protein [Ruminococcus sp.]
MNQLFKRFATALCAGMMLFSVSVPAVYAEEETEKIMLPSGKDVEWFQLQMDLTSRHNSENDRLFASAVVGLFQGDEVLYTGYYGETDIKNQVPADENSVYEWGSISKTLIWVSAMQLYEQGQLDLETDVREYLPEGFFQHLSYDEPITMLNLMNHNAGWQETTRPIWETEENKVLPLGEALQAIEPAQIHRPDEVSAYSNYGAGVAGYVIECITGQDYCEYVHEHIFEPLGMEHTALNPTHSDNAWVYEQRKNMKSYQFFLGNCVDLGYCLNYVPAYPAGAATGTLSDLMTYAQALVNEDAPLFQNPETQKLLFTGTDFYGDSDIPMCAHGFWCEEHAVRTYGHDGATTSGQADMIFDLDSKIGLVVMVNEPSGNWYINYASDMAFGELSPEKYSSGTAEKTNLDGYYLNARSTYQGMLKFIPYLTAFSLENLGNFEKLQNNLYQLRHESELAGESAIILGEKTYSDGNTAIQEPSVDLIHDRFYLVKLCLFTVYVLLAVIAVYLLLIRRKLKKHGKWTSYQGETVMTAGQIARIISFLALLGTYVAVAKSNGGIPYTTGAVLGIMQMLCIAVCGVSAVTSCIAIPSHQKEKKLILRYTLNTAGCTLPIIAILYFEMYRFWGC